MTAPQRSHGGRPHGKVGDTGLEWAGWQRTAEESMIWASRDDDPGCVLVSAQEAIEAVNRALGYAKNKRQRLMSNGLLEAAELTLAEAEAHAEHGVMNDDA